MTDKQIIDLFWNRNEDAIAATDAAYGRKLRGLSGRILQNLEDAEEIVSDTYMKTWDGNFVNAQLQVNLFRDNELSITESIVSLDPETVNEEIQKEYRRAIG